MTSKSGSIMFRTAKLTIQSEGGAVVCTGAIQGSLVLGEGA